MPESNLSSQFASKTGNRKLTNILMLILCGVFLVIAVVPLIWILEYVIKQGSSALSLDFFTHLPTPVGVPGGGIANALVGSAMTVGLALLMAAPVAILAAFYAATHAQQLLGLAIRFGTDVISGVPSIVMGIFAYAIVVKPQGHFSAFAGSVALAIIMLPIIVRSTEEMLKLLPKSLREAGLGIGAPEWRTSLQILLPAIGNGLLTGIMLAIARAGGEAAPMLFTAFGNPFMNTSFDQATATLPHTIFVYANSAYEDWRAKAWATALVLIAIVLILNVSARLIVWWRTRHLGTINY